MTAAAAWPALAASAAFGAVLGSFLNVCIHRLPRGTSVVTPPSACPRCRAPIRPYDNVPILNMSYDGLESATTRTRSEAFIHQARQRLEVALAARK